MANLRILARNIAETAELTESPAMVATLPGSNLQLPTERERVARTTSLAAQDVKLAWSADQKANMVAVTRHNFTTAAYLRALGYATNDWTSSTIFDTGATAAAFSTAGLNTDIDVYTEADFRHLKNTAQYFTGVTNMESMIVRWTDNSPANADGYMQATKLFVGQYFETTYQPPYGGVELTPMDDSVGGRAHDGSHLVSKGWKARRLVLDLQFIPDADLNDLLAIARYLGKDREAFISLYPGEGGVKELYNQMACRLIESPTFGPHFPGLEKTRLVFEET